MNQLEYLSEAEVIESLRHYYGHKGMVCKDLGCTRGQLNDYIVNHPAVRQELHDIKEAIKDEMENLIVERAKASDTILMFYAKTQMKDRGYGSSTEITGPNGGPVQMDARALIAAMREGLHGNSENEELAEDDFDRLLDGGAS